MEEFITLAFCACFCRNSQVEITFWSGGDVLFVCLTFIFLLPLDSVPLNASHSNGCLWVKKDSEYE